MKSPYPFLFFCLFCVVLVALALFLFLSVRGAERTAAETAVRRGALPSLFRPPSAKNAPVFARFTTHGSPHR